MSNATKKILGTGVALGLLAGFFGGIVHLYAQNATTSTSTATTTSTTSTSTPATSTPETVGDITICGRPGTDSFNACYYDGTNFETFKVQREDGAQLDFDWGTSSPHSIMEPDQFSAQWRGLFDFDPGTYEFTVTADDGFRLFVDNEEILSEWHDQPATTYTVRKEMAGGENRGVIAHYYENGGNAVAKLSWRKVEDDTATSTPQPPSVSEQYYPNAYPSAWYILPGQQLGFHGRGFAPNDSITIEEVGTDWKVTTMADGNGDFQVSNVREVPYLWQNTRRTFDVRGTMSGSATPEEIRIGVGSFYPQITPSPWWVAHGANMSVSGRDFAPNEEVRLLVNGAEIARKSADASGGVRFDFLAPDSGMQAELTAEGLSTGLTSSRTIYLHP